jgi:hypothetical protein
MKCPTVRETNGNIRTYYSGLYNNYGLNCLAVCNSVLWFLFFAVMGLGNKSDQPAYKETGFGEIFEKLPTWVPSTQLQITTFGIFPDKFVSLDTDGSLAVMGGASR